jgi:hypothetical protein
VWQAALGERTRQRDGVAGGDHDGRDFVRPVALEHQERNAAADAHGFGAVAARGGNVGRVHAPVLSTDDHDRLAGERERPLDDALQKTRIAGSGSRGNRQDKRQAKGNGDRPDSRAHMELLLILRFFPDRWLMTRGADRPAVHVQSIRQIGPMK